MSSFVHCDKCDATIPPFSSGVGHDGLDRKLLLMLGSAKATADFCPECYREVFTLIRSWFPAKQIEIVEPPKQLQPVPDPPTKTLNDIARRRNAGPLVSE